MPSPRYRQRPLHAGYRYQDLVAAMAMAAVLRDGHGEVAIESARHELDPFDDAVCRTADHSVRIQVKHHEKAGALGQASFENDRERLRLDNLVAAYDQAEAGSVELRLLTNWTSELDHRFVTASGRPSFARGVKSTRWQLDGQSLWPAGDKPAWKVLESVDRERFLEFCANFTIETDAPQMSGSLANPGPLERLLIARLRDDVGVEQYPNRVEAHRVASDLLEISGSLRNRRKRTIDFADIAREGALRVDRGAVPQTFP